VRFGDLDFIVTLGGELALAHAAVQSLPPVNFSYQRLKGQPGVSLGPQSSKEAPRHITLSLERSTRRASMALPFGLRNAAATAGHHLALCMVQPPTDNKFEHDPKTLHELLMEELESSSSSDSSRGSHHPSRECFMARTPEGHVEDVSREEATLTNDPDSRSRGEATPPSHLGMEQLRARKLEIDEARQELV